MSRFCIGLRMTISTVHSSALADEHCLSCSMAITSASYLSALSVFMNLRTTLLFRRRKLRRKAVNVFELWMRPSWRRQCKTRQKYNADIIDYLTCLWSPSCGRNSLCFQVFDSWIIEFGKVLDKGTQLQPWAHPRAFRKWTARGRQKVKKSRPPTTMSGTLTQVMQIMTA